jgi:hypothetical protein
MKSIIPAAWVIAGWMLVCGVGTTAEAGEKLEGIACRSVHLGFDVGPGVVLENEVVVQTTAPGTYFCVIGFHGGYFGIQEQSDGKRVVIFSVWDTSRGDDPKAVDEAQRVTLVHKHEQVRTGRFGGEGTGGQSFMDYDWQIGKVYRFAVRIVPAGERTEYHAYFQPAGEAWMKLVAFSRPVKATALTGFYSFVEDFKRNRESTKLARRAAFGPAWSLAADGTWHAARRAKFTGDRNPVMNIDGGFAEGRFFLVTGGETANVTVPLKEWVKWPEDVEMRRGDDPPQP